MKRWTKNEIIKLKEIKPQLFAFIKTSASPLVEYYKAPQTNPKSKFGKELQSYQLFFIIL